MSPDSPVTWPRGPALAGLAASMFLVTLDTAMVNLAGQAMRDDLGLSAADLALVATGYLVPFAGLLLLGGRLSDVLGGRRIYLTGMGIYLATTAFCAVAVNGPMLIAGRIGQGVGAAILVPSALAVALALSPLPQQRVRVVGLWGALAGAGGVLGVALGGVLTQAWGWESVFWVPVPLGAAAALLVLRAVPAMGGRPGRFDVPGAVTITGGISALAYGVVSAGEAGWGEPGSLAFIGLGMALLVAFVAVERRSAHPLVPLGVFRRGPLVRASGIVLLVGATAASMFFFLPLYFQQVHGLDASTGGLTMVPNALMIIVSSALAPQVAQRLDLARSCALGILLLLAGVIWLAVNPSDGGQSVHLLGPMVLLGLGVGFGQVNAIALAVRDAADDESGLLSGLVNAASQVGAAVGVAALSGVAIGAGVEGDIDFLSAFIGQAVLVVLALVLAVTLTARTRRTIDHAAAEAGRRSFS